MKSTEKIVLAPRNECTGCMACGDACPQNCIAFTTADDGFNYPVINHTECINCHTCQKTCPVLSKVPDTPQKQPSAYAVWADQEVRKESASGGAFYALAAQMIEDGGYVCGAVFDGRIVKHILTNDIQELKRIQGTKYFQSNTTGIFKEIKKLLKEDKKVLFSGTSCQVAGLLNVVGKDKENLITIDLICFGVPSSLIIDVEERMRGKRLRRVISCRDKNHDGGWQNAYWMTCEWDDGTTTITPPKQSFMLGSFCSGKVMRSSCYRCPFKSLSRMSDLTIGDYHNVKGFDEEKKDGVSLVYTHTASGERMLHHTHGLTINQRDIREALSQKRTIYYNDGLFEKRIVRRFMPILLKKAPVWLLVILYQNIIKSKNPLVWPLTAIDIIYYWINILKSRKQLKRIISELK